MRKNKVGGFIDRRIGENNPSLSQEEKMLIRFQKTRQKQLSKSNIYNLDDDNEEEFLLTHKGRAISELYDDAEDETEIIEEDSMEEMVDEEDDFGGLTKVDPMESEERQKKYKSKNEIMNELISKSKYYKYMSQKELEERMELTNKLDEEFKELRELLGIQNTRNKSKILEEFNEDEDEEGEKKDNEEEEENEEYTDEENMSNKEDEEFASDNDKEIESLDDDPTDQKIKAINLGEDIIKPEDDYDKLAEMLSRPGIKKAKASDPLSKEEARQKEQEEKLKELKKEKLERMKHVDDEDEDFEIFDEQPKNNKKNNKKLEKHSVDDGEEKVIKESKLKELKERFTDIIETVKDNSLNIMQTDDPKEVSDILENAYALSKEALDILHQTRKELASISKVQIRELYEQYLDMLSKAKKDDSVVPPISTIFFAQLMSILWPVTDRRHYVITPLVIALGNMISSCRIQTIGDMRIYFLLLNLFYSYIEGAKRFASEPLIALFTILNLFYKQNEKKDLLEESLNPLLIVNKDLLTIKDMKKIGKDVNLDIPICLTTLNDSSLGDDVSKLRLVNYSLDLLSNFMNLYKDDVACIELYITYGKILEKFAKIKHLPSPIQIKAKNIIQLFATVSKSLASNRYPLQQFKKVVEPVSELTPDFQNQYFGARTDNESKIARDHKKLKKKLKSEQKSVEKELKLDSYFIEKEKMKKKIEQDEKNKKILNKLLQF